MKLSQVMTQITLCLLQYKHRKETMQLRPHQEKALQAMADNDLGQVIVPTGGGKTMCMIHDVILSLIHI